MEANAPSNDNYKSTQYGVKTPDGAVTWFDEETFMGKLLATPKGRADRQAGFAENLLNQGLVPDPAVRLRFRTRERVVVFVNDKKIVDAD